MIKLEKIFLPFVIILLMTALTGCGDRFDSKGYDYSWLEKNRYICHALGSIDEYSYTNSKEAFLQNYEKGYRVFEIDIKITSDDELVLFHSWRNKDIKKILGIERDSDENKEPLSSEEFLGAKIYGKYTPLSFEDFTKIIKDYPDCYIVIDGKYGAEESEEISREYEKIYSTIMQYAPEMIDHFIPQIYFEDMLDMIMDVYSWNSIIYTWYGFDNDPEFEAAHEAEFAREKGIRVITLNEEREKELHESGELKEILLDKGFKCFVHTINDDSLADEYFSHGIYGIYTDSLLE
ncbi:phosphatidylinositol-specific phospholipase C/glycerophosphodiester phosphodiesterase family protein [Lachnospiraceae bacterium C1.1]|nr:phosphatidylinositol-specific phospholipase C/glycerophosphodiester phosphodiesterase family protein [Lachnospiraceae bacterium C1.1]